MKRNFIKLTAVTIAAIMFTANTVCTGQSVNSISRKYLTSLPSVPVSKKLRNM